MGPLVVRHARRPLRACRLAGRGAEFGGQGSNLQQPAPKAGVLPIELPPIGTASLPVSRAPLAVPGRAPFRTRRGTPARFGTLMGSLIKKRRKRMRKKKHKKMLKRTRWQRRAAGK